MIGTGFYTDDIDKTISALQKKIETNTHRDLAHQIWITLTSHIVVGIIGSYIYRSIYDPLTQVTYRLNDISEGEGDLTQRLPDQRKDELGDLARAFNRFVSSIQTVVTAAARNTLDVEDLVGDANQKVAQAVTANDNKSLQTESVASAISSLSAAAKEVAKNVHDSSDRAALANAKSANARHTVSQSSSAMNKLATQLEKAANVIASLESDVQSIASVLDVIRGISDQTNLLALNAAIEAALAGDALQ